ncbi:hypothetical protein [Spirosoma flavum]|uniref:CUB domain-containing protein n=1 Tax=Spirosoma flavum TaxID=2048557 RepID=A0ABW6AJ84_9BACT
MMMNRIPFFLTLLGLCLSLSTASYAQVGINAPAGVSPTQDVEIYTRNGFLVQQQYTRTTADPAAYTATMSCPTSPSLTALAGTLKDPSGDANYTAGTGYNCSASISTGNGTVRGLEIIFTDLNTDPVNSTVVITDIHGNSQQFSGSTLPGRMVIPFTSLNAPDPIALGSGIVIRFQTNSSVSFGRGFSLQWRALLFNPTTPTTSIAISNAMQFDVNAGSFKAGHNNTASGVYSTATGSKNTASGDYSTAMWSSISTNSKRGAFMIGDSDPLTQGTTLSSVTDQFVGRFLNGYYLMTCGDLNPGGETTVPCVLA